MQVGETQVGEGLFEEDVLELLYRFKFNDDLIFNEHVKTEACAQQMSIILDGDFSLAFYFQASFLKLIS